MASPPFNINQSLPGDSDIVSQHPPNARTFRDVVESWLSINHDTNGNHFRIDIPRAASPTTPASGVDVLFISTTGRLKIKHPDGTEEFVGIPPGFFAYTSTNIPVGWLVADGSAVSRSTYADLYNEISISYGAGDGSTTFNLPDLRGRILIGEDRGSGRITTATVSAVSNGGVGGNQLSTLVASNVPGGVSVSVSSLSVSVSVPTINVTVSGSITGSSSGSTASSSSVSGSASGGTVTGTATGSVTGSASVTSSDNLVLVGGISDNYSSVAGTGTYNTPTRKALTSSGSITGSISSGAISGSLSSPASVTASFSGASVSTGSVSGTFSGTGTGSGSGTGTGTGLGATTGSATAFSNMPPVGVFTPLIKY